MTSEKIEKAFSIESGAALSEAMSLDGGTPVAVQIPTTWTAAVLTFQVSYDGQTWGDLYFNGVEYTISGVPTSGGGFMALDPRAFVGAEHIKVRSGTTGTPVNQGAARSCVMVARGW